MSINLRLATDKDIEWVNHCYAQIDFLPSKLSEHKVIIASIDECDAGIGRLVPLDRDIWELGGIYTLPEFRKQGVAAMLVQGLLKEAANCTVYCIPFAELKKLLHLLWFPRIHQFLSTIARKIVSQTFFLPNTIF